MERFDHASGLIHDDHAAGTGHASCSHEGVEIHGNIDLIGHQNLRRDATGNDSLELAAITHTTGTFDEMPQGYTHGLFVDAGPHHMPAHAEKPCAALTVGTHAGKALGSLAQNVWDTGQGLHIVDDGRAREETRNGWEWGLDPGKAFPALKRSKQSGLFAADLGAGSTVDSHVQGKPGPPRPRSLALETSLITCSGVIEVRAFRAARYPPSAT